jgi:hypothetical protein
MTATDDGSTNVPRPDYLIPEMTGRGFAGMPAVNGEYGGEVDAYESSAASGPHVWLRIHDGAAAPAVHLTAENAWRLAEQLRTLVRNHYQGDATPEWAVTGGAGPDGR